MTVETFNPNKVVNKTTTLETPVKVLSDNKPSQQSNGSRIGFVSLGCPKNLVDSERILTQLRTEGYDVVPTYNDADLVIVNTCGFIDAAVEESLDTIGEALKENGITLATVKTLRDNRTQDPRINSLSKHNCIAACIEADKLGVNEGLMLDPNGFVSTCNSTNFFIVRDGQVWTSTGEYCLNGVTRGSIIRLCKEYDVPVFEKNFILNDVHTAGEVFVTGTFAGVIPVISVDGTTIGDGTRGPLTESLQGWYALDIESLAQK